MPRHNRRTFLKVSGAVLGGIAMGTEVTAATRTDRFVVDTKGKASIRRLERAGLEVVHDIEQVDLAVVKGAESDLKSVTRDFEPDIEIELDGKNPAVLEESTEDATDEPLYPIQWDKQAQDIPKAHETTRGEGTRVAVIDDGVLGDHPDLQHAYNEDLSRNFTNDDNGIGPLADDHGTHVAGTVVADDENDIGVVGTAPGAEVVDLRVFSGAAASFGNIVAAVAYSAAIDADVANLSLGAYPIPREGLGSFYGGVLNRVMTHANKEGTLLVIAAGNDSADLQQDGGVISLPNEGAQGLSVAATGPNGFAYDASEFGGEAPPESPAFYTNYGTNDITVAAPGGDVDEEVLSTAPPDRPDRWFYDLVLSTTFAIPEDSEEDEKLDTYTPSWGWKAGTSMAAPQVAGAAALVKSANPDYNANQVESALKRAADVPDEYDKEFYGSGFLNVLDAL